MTTGIQYDGATGVIVACGQFDRAPDGLLLGVVYDDTPLAQPGTKRLVAGRVELTPPPQSTATEVAAAQAEAQAAQGDRDAVRTAIAHLLADARALSDPTQVLTVAQVRPMLARTDVALATLLRVLRRADLI